MGAAAMVGQGLGGFVKTFADVQSDSANMQIARRNEVVEQWKAGDALARGEIMASRKAGEGTQREGAIAAHAAGSGVDVSASGSVVKAQESSKGMNALDIATIRSNAAREMFGHQIAAQDYDIQAQQYKMKSLLDPFANLLGTSAQIATTSYQNFGTGGSNSGNFTVGSGSDAGWGPSASMTSAVAGT